MSNEYRFYFALVENFQGFVVRNKIWPIFQLFVFYIANKGSSKKKPRYGYAGQY